MKRVLGRKVISFIVVLSMLASFIIMPSVGEAATPGDSFASDGNMTVTQDGDSIILENSGDEIKEVIIGETIDVTENTTIKMSDKSKSDIVLVWEKNDVPMFNITAGKLTLDGIKINATDNGGDTATEIISVRTGGALELINTHINANTAVVYAYSGSSVNIAGGSVIENNHDTYKKAVISETNDMKIDASVKGTIALKGTDAFISANETYGKYNFVIDAGEKLDGEVLVNADGVSADFADKLIAYYSETSGKIKKSDTDSNLVKGVSAISDNDAMDGDGNFVKFAEAAADSSITEITLLKDIADFEGVTIDHAVTIDGAGHTISAKSGAAKFIEVNVPSKPAEIKNVTLKGSGGCSVINVVNTGSGGSFKVGNNTVICDNDASGAAIDGAGINIADESNVEIDGAVIKGNKTNGRGGALYISSRGILSPNVTIKNTEITENMSVAKNKGAGITVNNGKCTIGENTKVYGNTMTSGTDGYDLAILKSNLAADVYLEKNVGRVDDIYLGQYDKNGEMVSRYIYVESGLSADKIFNITLSENTEENTIVNIYGGSDVDTGCFHVTNDGLRAVKDGITIKTKTSRIVKIKNGETETKYDTLAEAFQYAGTLTTFGESSLNVSVTNPVIITLMADTTIDSTITVPNGAYIKLVSENENTYSVGRAAGFSDVMFDVKDHLELENVKIFGDGVSDAKEILKTSDVNSAAIIGLNSELEQRIGTAVTNDKGKLVMNGGKITAESATGKYGVVINSAMEIGASFKMYNDDKKCGAIDANIFLEKDKQIKLFTEDAPSSGTFNVYSNGEIGDVIVLSDSRSIKVTNFFNKMTFLNVDKHIGEADENTRVVITSMPLNVILGSSENKGEYSVFPNAKVESGSVIKSIELVFTGKTEENNKIELPNSSKFDKFVVSDGLSNDNIKIINIETTTGEETNSVLVQEYLQAVKFYTSADQSVRVFLSEKTMSADDVVYYYAGNGHYYKYKTENTSWDSAYNYAGQQTYNGYKGYLLTLTDENEMAYLNSVSGKASWLGGTRAKKDKVLQNDGSVNLTSLSEKDGYETYFYWLSGPEGKQADSKNSMFFNGRKGGDNKPDQSEVVYTYAPWHDGEPNNNNKSESEESGSGYAAMSGKDTNYTWYDYPKGQTNEVSGYYIEFGGLDLQETAGNDVATSDAIISDTPAASYNGTNYNTLTEAVEAACSGTENDASIQLLKDINLIKGIEKTITVPEGKNIQINGNGKSIIRNSSMADQPMAEVSGNIQIKNTVFDGGANWSSSDVKTRVNNSIYAQAPVISVTAKGSAVLDSNTVIKNNFNISGTKKGTVNAAGSLTLNECVIEDNYAVNGGAVYAIGTNIVFNNGAVIKNNTAAKGGAVYMNAKSQVQLVKTREFDEHGENCAKITGNYADQGGMIYVDTDAKLTSDNVYAEGNTVSTENDPHGDGIYLNGNMELNGGYIYDNIYIPEGKHIDVNKIFDGKPVYAVDAVDATQEDATEESKPVIKCSSEDVAIGIVNLFVVEKKQNMKVAISNNDKKNLIVKPAKLEVQGIGTGYEYYDIYTKADLEYFLKLVNDKTLSTCKNAELRADIDLRNDALKDPIGITSNEYTGIFNGNGFTVSGVNVKKPNSDEIGLFGIVNGGTIKNLNVEGTFTGKHDVGVIAGCLKTGSMIYNCKSYGNVTANGGQAGGIVGFADKGTTIINCGNHADIVMNYTQSGTLSYTGVGGIAGFVNASVTGISYVLNCYNAGNVKSAFGGNERDVYAGGIVGYAQKALKEEKILYIDNIYNIGDVRVNSADQSFTGHLIGMSGGTSVKEKINEEDYYGYYKKDCIANAGTVEGGEEHLKIIGESMTDEDMKSAVLSIKLNEATAVLKSAEAYKSISDFIRYWKIDDKSDYKYPTLLTTNEIPIQVKIIGDKIVDGKEMAMTTDSVAEIKAKCTPALPKVTSVKFNIYDSDGTTKLGDAVASVDPNVSITEERAVNTRAEYPVEQAGIYSYQIEVTDMSNTNLDENIKQPLTMLVLDVDENTGKISPTNSEIAAHYSDNSKALYYMAGTLDKPVWKKMDDSGKTPSDILFNAENIASFRIGTSETDDTGLEAKLSDNVIAPAIELEKADGKYTGYVTGVMVGMKYSYTDINGEVKNEVIEADDMPAGKFAVPIDLSTDAGKRKITFEKVKKPAEGEEVTTAPKTELVVPKARAKADGLSAVSINYDSETGSEPKVHNANDVQYSLDGGLSWINCRDGDENQNTVDVTKLGDKEEALFRNQGTADEMPSECRVVYVFDESELKVDFNSDGNIIIVSGRFAYPDADNKVYVKTAIITAKGQTGGESADVAIDENGNFKAEYPIDNVGQFLGENTVNLEVSGVDDKGNANKIVINKKALLLILDRENGIIKGIEKGMTYKFADAAALTEGETEPEPEVSEWTELNDKDNYFSVVDGVPAMEIPENWYNNTIKVKTTDGLAVATVVIGKQIKESTPHVGMDIPDGLLTNVKDGQEYSTDGIEWKPLTEKLQYDMFNEDNSGKLLKIRKKSSGEGIKDSDEQLLQLVPKAEDPADFDVKNIKVVIAGARSIISISEAAESQQYSLDNADWKDAVSGTANIILEKAFADGDNFDIYTRIKGTETKFPSLAQKSTNVTVRIDADGNITLVFKATKPDEIDPKDITVYGNTITVKSVEGVEYTIDNGSTWHQPILKGGVLETKFRNLLVDTEYTVKARTAATENLAASDMTNGTKVRTDKLPVGDTPTKDEIGTIIPGPDHILIKPANPEMEYSIDKGENWVSPEKDKDGVDYVLFDNLDPDKEYTVLVRRKGTETKYPSEEIDVPVKTDKLPDSTTAPTANPTVGPTTEPTVEPTTNPTVEPTTEPTAEPTLEPTPDPTTAPTAKPKAKKPDAVNKKDVTVGSTNIKIKAVQGQEYSVDDGDTWHKPKDGAKTVTISGLDKSTEYDIITRVAETEEFAASDPSDSLTVKTTKSGGGGGGGGGGGSSSTRAPSSTAAATTAPVSTPVATVVPVITTAPADVTVPPQNKTGKTSIVKTMDIITTAVVKGGPYAGRHLPTYIITDEKGETTAIVTNLEDVEYELIYTSVTFNDMIKHWARSLVNEAARRKIVKGYEDDSFRGDNLITRAEFAAIVTRALGLLPREDSCFTDVEPEHWFYGEVATAYEFGLIEGVGDGRFEPNRTITREEGMLIIKRAGELVKYSPDNIAEGAEMLKSYGDYNEVSEWAQSGLQMCLAAGIVTGRNPWTLAPKSEMTRAETAAVIIKLLQKAALINE